MKHIKAEAVLPQALLEEIQRYIKGQYIYIPKHIGARGKWGEKTGIKQALIKRNREIQDRFEDGHSIKELAECYYLSCASIKKIVYQRK